MGATDTETEGAAASAPHRLFISYAHGDRARVEPIVEALERLGHIVWWDSHLAGGSSFAEKIDAELTDADAIIVMWSAASRKSHWVLDEAGRGRDTGRLVPILLDGTPPPLGFGQLQAIDFSHWRGAMDGAPIVALAQAITGQDTAGHRHSAPRVRRIWGAPPWVLAVASAALLTLVAGLGFMGWRALSPVAAKTLSIAVLPFADLGGSSGDHFAEGVSEEILNTLARDKGLKVLGRTSSWSLKDKVSDLPYLRDTLGVGHLLEGSVRQAGPRVRVNVRMITTEDGSEVWTEGFDRTGGDLFALQDEIGAKIASRLGSTDKAEHVAQKTTDAVFRDVVVARQLIRTREVPAMERALALMKAATVADPNYAPAWAMLARTTMLLSDSPTTYGTIPVLQAAPIARTAANRAIAIDPQLAEGYAALGLVQGIATPGGGVRDLERAIALDPQSVTIRSTLSAQYANNGQIRAAIGEGGAIIALDPLYAVPVSNLVLQFMLANDEPAAAQAAIRFKALATDPGDIAVVMGSYLVNRGDLAKALAGYDAALVTSRSALIVRKRFALLGIMYAADRIRATPTAKAVLGEQYGLYSDGLDADVPRIMELPIDSIFHDSTAATVLTELGRERDIARLFHARFPGAVAVDEIVTWAPFDILLTARALAMTGDSGNATILRDAARTLLDRYVRDGQAKSTLPFELGMLALGDGKPAVALDRLDDGFKRQWVFACNGPFWIGTFPPFASLRGNPRFEAVLAGCRTKINEQRRLAGMVPVVLR